MMEDYTHNSPLIDDITTAFNKLTDTFYLLRHKIWNETC